MNTFFTRYSRPDTRHLSARKIVGEGQTVSDPPQGLTMPRPMESLSESKVCAKIITLIKTAGSTSWRFEDIKFATF